MSGLDCYIIWGSDPDDEANKKLRPLSIELEQGEADVYLMNGLLQTLMGHMQILSPGGQLSILVTRGREAGTEEPDPPGTVATFVINNPGTTSDRHAWDFRVEKRAATQVPLHQPTER